MNRAIYSDDVIGDGMAIFDRLPKRVRDRLNDGIVTQKVEDMAVIARVIRTRGEDEVLRLLREADQQRRDGKL